MTISRNFLIFTFAFACCISLGVASWLSYRSLHRTATRMDKAQATALHETRETTKQLDLFIATLEATATQLVAKLQASHLDQKAIIELLKTKPAYIAGMSIMQWNRDTIEPISAPCYVEKNGQEIATSYTNTASLVTDATSWYTTFKHAQGYVGPIVDPVSGDTVIAYAAPYNTDSIVVVTQSINHLRHILTTLYAGTTCYWFMVNTDGTILLHPYEPYTKKPTTLDALAQQTHQSQLETAARDIKKQQSGMVTYHDTLADGKAWLMYQSLPSVGWSLCGVFALRELGLNEDTARRSFIAIALSVLIFVLLILALITVVHSNITRVQLWYITALASGAILVTIMALWYFAKNYPEFKHATMPVKGKMELYNFLDTLQGIPQKNIHETSENKLDTLNYYLNYRYKKGRYVPTGIFIHYMQFTSENQINIVGYVWQRYFDGIHEGITRGFVLPQATTDVSINEIYRTKVEKQETIIWRVNATLNQHINYARYPFDTRDIQIQLWHADFSQNIILVPDIDAYATLIPTALPGLSQNAEVPNWDIEGSTFGYKKDFYTTIFGLYSYGPFGTYQSIKKSDIPELYFEVTARRYLIDTLLDDLIPLVIIVLLLFIVFMVDIPLRYDSFPCYLALFFGLAVSQLHFRSKIPANQLTFF